MKKSLAVGLLVLAGVILFLVTQQRKTSPRAVASAAPEQPVTTNANQIAAPSTPSVPGAAPASPRPAGQVTSPLPASRRPWDYTFFAVHSNAVVGTVIEFALADGQPARGRIEHVEHADGELIWVAGEVTSPEPGRFSFRKQTLPGKAGDYSGEVTFPRSQRAFRLEPVGPNGTTELVARRLDEVVCLLPPPDDATLAQDAAEIPPLNPSSVPDYVPPYNGGIISLQSLPGAVGVIYLDYRGGYTPTWGGITYDKPNASNAQIKDVWKRVAEDYMPFNINVTTDIRVYEAAPENSRQRCVLTPTTTAAPGAGGVAYIGDWNSTGDRPCWAFYSTGKAAAEVVSHEVGHTLGLSHDGRTAPYNEGYFGGQGSGATGWAPIMGVGYYQPVVQWSKGEYAYANQTQDDLNIIASNNNNVDYRTDDTGPTLGTARYLEVYSNFTASAEGVVETTDDTDAFRFTTTGGTVTLTANPVGDWADLAIMATLADASDTVIASNNPQNVLSASISTNLSAGTYTFRVTGAGRNDPLTNGFSSYASLGYYSITGSVAGAALASRFSIAENSPNGTTVGTITATNLGVDTLTYTIVAGNTADTFALDNNGVLTVANAAALNYEALGAQSSFPVQFELFVDINNLTNPGLTELNRRVVVRVLDVNEAPSLTGFTNSLIAHTQPGTLVGTLAASDPDAYTVLSFAILSGNNNGVFALNSVTGDLTVAGDLDPAVQAVYNLAVRVTDNGSPVLSATNFVQLAVATNTSPFQPGTIRYAVYDGIGSGNLISDLTNNARFPRDPDWEQPRATFEGDTDRGDGYGSAMRGYLIPPATGLYTFWIASDDNGELWLGGNTNPASAVRIAYISGSSSWAGPREWTKYASQKSAARTLIAGQAYYIEARQKEGGGGDNLAVGWSGPATAGQTNVIAGLYLAPYFLNYVPRATGFAANVRRDAFLNAAVGRVTVTDVNTNDGHTFTLLSGNVGGVFAVDTSGWVRIASETALQASVTTNFTLSIRVADNGAPPLATTTSVSLTLISPDTIAVTNLQREMFYNLGTSTSLASLTNNVKYPGRPDGLLAFGDFSTDQNVADGYGSRARGYVVPSVSGDYRFFLSSDDDGQLRFSPNENPSNAVLIASVTGWSDVTQWTKFPSQTSPLQVGLVAGQRYYLEVLQKDGSGGDHFEVGWLVSGSGVTNVIPAANLQPVDLNYAPRLINNPSVFISPNVTNGQTVATLVALDSPLDTLTYKIAGGNSNNTFAVNAASGVITVADNTAIADGSVTAFPLTVAVQDSGYGGRYPLKTAQTNLTVSVVGVSIAPVKFAATVAGSQLTLAWPPNHTGWTLQAQTNALATGLRGDAWVAVPGSSATNAITVPIDPTQPSVFYRLTYP
ncbi:MAG TPA: cadherin domain-containing protein [Verrucomicrobiae bacterium]|nr:cadherin domain-containing protein [Verrucomicrobiae bacterium]